MAITFVGDTSKGVSNGTGTFNLTKPTGVVSGDLLIAVTTQNDQDPTMPSGWTKSVTCINTSQSFYTTLMYKVAGGSEPSSYTFTVPDNSFTAGFVGQLFALRGVDVSPATDWFGGGTYREYGSQSEPLATGSCTNTASTGRAFYLRAVRTSAATVALTASGVSGLPGTDGATVTATSQSGGTRYSQRIFCGTADFTGGGNPASIDVNGASTDDDGNNILVWTVAANPGVSAAAGGASVTAAANNTAFRYTPATLSTDTTATAYGATVLTGVAAEDTGYGVVTATAYNAKSWVIFPSTAGATAYGASVHIDTDAGSAPVTASMATSSGYFGAPAARTWRIPAESRSLPILAESRVYRVEA